MINLLDPLHLQKQRVALIGFLRGAEMPTALSVLYLAEQFHSGVRKDGVTPEFAHQIQIALYLTTLNLHKDDLEVVIIAALTHDLFEDYGKELTPETFAERCGYSLSPATSTRTHPWNPNFSQGVQSAMTLSKIRDGHKLPNVQYFSGVALDAFSALVKGSDRINNFQSMSGVFSAEKQKKYLEEGLEILAYVKEARKRFPALSNAFFNVEFVLKSQVELLSIMLDIHPTRKNAPGGPDKSRAFRSQ